MVKDRIGQHPKKLEYSGRSFDLAVCLASFSDRGRGMTDSLDRLKSALADRYQIERELGAGGMATVCLAHDLKHDRKVAIKVLRPELSASIGVDRFLREIQIAAKLNHPHILPLLDSGSAEEQPTALRQTGLTAGLVPYRRTAYEPSDIPTVRPSAFLYYVMPYAERRL